MKDEPCARVRDDDAYDRAKYAQGEALNQRLAHQLRTRRAESNAERRLMPILQAARQQKVGDVRACLLYTSRCV